MCTASEVCCANPWAHYVNIALTSGFNSDNIKPLSKQFDVFGYPRHNIPLYHGEVSPPSCLIRICTVLPPTIDHPYYRPPACPPARSPAHPPARPPGRAPTRPPARPTSPNH